ncbi:hypothetical protein ABI_20920 [Asticcacaulis biprosthecium C19]|uniref:DUF6968 domain-containing protein n=1 Tax=Asticcacaulis biprosthecium C19 TaxID=715226 RepID=F4QGH0_9CAUL|nr:hypothetical protein [Asticcacaulis biprosthecium]EGF93651.1 hypothetical protein ABI_20920 [Asticcacaulis biprosthecium C19]
MSEPDIQDAVLIRRFDLKPGGHVDIFVWKPEPHGRNDARCPYRIVGIGAEKLYHGYGVDPVQAMSLTLQAISTKLYTSEAYRSGNLTWLGSRDLGLPLQPGELPDTDDYEKAALLSTAGGSTVVAMPGQRFPYVAFPADRLHGLIRQLDALSTADTTSKKTLKRIMTALGNELRYYEAVCHRAGFDVAQALAEG